MVKNTQPALDELSPEDAYFELQAFLGTTKHMGDFATTYKRPEGQPRTGYDYGRKVE